MPITLKKVIAAVKRDDGTGFCKGCGNSQKGCEPDARGYTCQKCGAPKVYGAEELLFEMA